MTVTPNWLVASAGNASAGQAAAAPPSGGRSAFDQALLGQAPVEPEDFDRVRALAALTWQVAGAADRLAGHLWTPSVRGGPTVSGAEPTERASGPTSGDRACRAEGEDRPRSHRTEDGHADDARTDPSRRTDRRGRGGRRATRRPHAVPPDRPGTGRVHEQAPAATHPEPVGTGSATAANEAAANATAANATAVERAPTGVGRITDAAAARAGATPTGPPATPTGTPPTEPLPTARAPEDPRVADPGAVPGQPPDAGNPASLRPVGATPGHGNAATATAAAPLTGQAPLTDQAHGPARTAPGSTRPDGRTGDAAALPASAAGPLTAATSAGSTSAGSTSAGSTSAAAGSVPDAPAASGAPAGPGAPAGSGAEGPGTGGARRDGSAGPAPAATTAAVAGPALSGQLGATDDSRNPGSGADVLFMTGRPPTTGAVVAATLTGSGADLAGTGPGTAVNPASSGSPAGGQAALAGSTAAFAPGAPAAPGGPGEQRAGGDRAGGAVPAATTEVPGGSEARPAATVDTAAPAGAATVGALTGHGGGPTTPSTATGAGSATSPSTAAPAGETGPDPVIEQVTKHLLATRLLQDGTQRAVLHLTPDHLGSVRVTVDVRAGQVRVDLAAGDTALSTLRRELGDLRSQLAQSGLQLADVTLHESGGDVAGGGTGGHNAQPWSADPGAGGSGEAGGTVRSGTSEGSTSRGQDRPGGRQGPPDAVGLDSLPPVGGPAGVDLMAADPASGPGITRLDIRV
jgi:flagellar hook-length control protein FliK